MSRVGPGKMKRGDLVTIALSCDFGKPRPALVIQSDRFGDHSSVTILLVTSTLANAPLLRVNISPDAGNGLRRRSQIMVDKAMTVPRQKLGAPFGSIDAGVMLEVERCLAVFLGIAR